MLDYRSRGEEFLRRRGRGEKKRGPLLASAENSFVPFSKIPIKRTLFPEK
jgi:hypothetical protein